MPIEKNDRKKKVGNIFKNKIFRKTKPDIVHDGTVDQSTLRQLELRYGKSLIDLPAHTPPKQKGRQPTPEAQLRKEPGRRVFLKSPVPAPRTNYLKAREGAAAIPAKAAPPKTLPKPLLTKPTEAHESNIATLGKTSQLYIGSGEKPKIAPKSKNLPSIVGKPRTEIIKYNDVALQRQRGIKLSLSESGKLRARLEEGPKSATERLRAGSTGVDMGSSRHM